MTSQTYGMLSEKRMVLGKAALCCVVFSDCDVRWSI